MPKYFKTRAEQLHAEALASLILLENRYFSAHSVAESLRLCLLVNNARNRVLRRWQQWNFGN